MKKILSIFIFSLVFPVGSAQFVYAQGQIVNHNRSHARNRVINQDHSSDAVLDELGFRKKNKKMLLKNCVLPLELSSRIILILKLCRN
jgi:hypothetical protein